MPDKKQPKKSFTTRLSPDVLEILDTLKKHQLMSRTAIIEIAVRELKRRIENV